MSKQLIVALYSYSLDSKAAAALLEKYCKHPVKVFFHHYGHELPKSMPSPKYSDITIIPLGTTATLNKEQLPMLYEKALEEPSTMVPEGTLVSWPGDMASACYELYRLSHTENDILEPIPEHNLRWIDLIVKFHLRQNSTVDQTAYGFSLFLSMRNTWLSSNAKKAPSVWHNLMFDEQYFDYVNRISGDLLAYKNEQLQYLSEFIFSMNINGNECLLINKRDMDSSVFLNVPDKDKYDFFICFQDKYNIREIVINENPITRKVFGPESQPTFKFTPEEFEVVKYFEPELIFTIYKNKNKSTLEFAKSLSDKAAGHDRVATFFIEHRDLGLTVNDVDIVPSTSLYGRYETLYQTISDKTTTTEDPVIKITSTVKTFISSEIRYLKGSTGKVHTADSYNYKGLGLMYINGHVFPSLVEDLPPIFTYVYKPDFIKALITRLSSSK